MNVEDIVDSIEGSILGAISELQESGSRWSNGSFYEPPEDLWDQHWDGILEEAGGQIPGHLWAWWRENDEETFDRVAQIISDCIEYEGLHNEDRAFLVKALQQAEEGK